MMNWLKKIIHHPHPTLKHIHGWLPLVAVILTGLLIALTNIHPQLAYTGWDNILAELNFPHYVNQVVGGAWLEHQGLGAPMNLTHLAEVPRLPILWLLITILPANLVRITFIFAMYILGGITMYWYLSKIWLNQKNEKYRNWLASLGAVLYLLHILTLQQFYIAFEMFTVQFAFFPLLLLCLHQFLKPVTSKTVLSFLLLQLLIAPSAHTATNFYLAAMSSIAYIFFLLQPKNMVKAIKTSLIVGMLTFVANSYWIIPNFYYLLQDSNYVHESHDNQLFAPESVSSVKEAGTWSNFFKGTQYLFQWKDYSFVDQKHEFIFNDWQDHLNKPMVSGLLTSIGVATVIGGIWLIFDRSKGSKRWAVLLIYVGCASFIWMDLFPSKYLFNLLYQSNSFTEAFRNPFTKLSIIYSVMSVILFISGIEKAILLLNKSNYQKLATVLSSLLISLTLLGIGYTALPSFTGHFISEKLQVKYPAQYAELFTYLNSQDKNLRILPLPQLNHAGWEYYDWQFLGVDNGYQGMGFYYAGIFQPVLHRDSDRWVETSDFFYYELKYALDNQDLELFMNVIKKYNVDLVLIDETKIEPGESIDYPAVHQFVQESGFTVLWQKDFLTLYAKNSLSTSDIVIPEDYTLVDTYQQRVTQDIAYATQGDYIESEKQLPSISFPFSDLFGETVDPIYAENSVSIHRTLPDTISGNLVLTIPSTPANVTPAAVTYARGKLLVQFPQTEIQIGDQIIPLDSPVNQSFILNTYPHSVYVIFNDQVVEISQDETKLITLDLRNGSFFNFYLAPVTDRVTYLSDGSINGLSLELTPLGQVGPFMSQTRAYHLSLTQGTTISATTSFPQATIDLSENNPENCSQPIRGELMTDKESNTTQLYSASNYAVSCSGVVLNTISTWSDYLFRIEGENIQGRGIKLFINRHSETQADDDMFSSAKYDQTLALHSFLGTPESSIFLNWETRSFGQEAVDRIKKMSVTAFPLQQLGSIQLSTESENTNINNLEVTNQKEPLPSLYTMEMLCSGDGCLFGLDQSYDLAWLSYAVPSNKSLFSGSWLNHSKLNGWANAWTVPPGEYHIYIFYWPQLLVFAGFAFLIITFIGLSVIVIKSKPQLSNRRKLSSHLRQKLLSQ